MFNFFSIPVIIRRRPMNPIQDSPREKVGECVTLYPRGGRWWAEYYRDGRQERRSLKTRSKKQARIEASRLDTALISGVLEDPSKASRPLVGIEEAIDSYLAQLRAEGRRESTVQRYQAPLRRFADFAAQHNITTVNRVSIRLASDFRTLRYDQVQPKTLSFELRVIKQFLGHAVAHEMIPYDPLQKLKVPKARPRPQPVYSLENVEAILHLAPAPWASVFSLLHYCPVISRAMATGYANHLFRVGHRMS
jgi:hypothetical protein